MKKKLGRGLGKKVKEEDIFSISQWMKVDQKTLDTVIHDHSLSHEVIGKMEEVIDPETIIHEEIRARVRKRLANHPTANRAEES